MTLAPFKTMRGRLLLLALLVEALMLGLLVSNSLRLLLDNMGEQAKDNAEQIAPVLNAALVAPMAQYDYVTVQAVLDESKAVRGIDYIAVSDSKGHIVAQSGWPLGKTLPAPDSIFSKALSENPARYDVVQPIKLAGQPLGKLHFGLDLSRILEARGNLLTQGILIAVSELLLSAGLLTLLGLLITRQLSLLTHASLTVAEGGALPSEVPEGKDDIGRLGAAFNAMSRAVSERMSQLTQAHDELVEAKNGAEAANIAKSQFLATMSHEIRTPMNGILGMAQLLQAPEIAADERRDYVQTILSSGQTLLTLLNDILDLSKVEAGKLELEFIPVAPQRILTDTEFLFREAAQKKHLQLISQWQGPEQHYAVDPVRLRQMLTNLLSNAIKFTEAGQIQMLAREVSRDEQSAVLEFSVRDSGIGMPQDKLQLVFQPFLQADTSITRKFGGTGLGLSIVRSLAEIMQGSAGVESEEGKGSRFWFRISAKIVAAPQQTEKIQINEYSSTPPPGKGTSRCILVVDDNMVNQKVVSLMLCKLGLSVETAENGQLAVERVADGLAIDLVLMDCQMPVLDGFSATEMIRQREKENGLPRLPVIALTAGAFEEDRQHCLAAGMDDFLTKPIDQQKLTQLLQRWFPVNETTKK
jgi:signal transduction histidine kinase/CheY-like chemotaxis protein